MESVLKKRQKLRNNEYYDMQEIFDDLYEDSKNGLRQRELMKYIQSKLLNYNPKSVRSALLDSNSAVLEYAKTMTWNEVEPHVSYIEEVYETGKKISKKL